MSKYIQFEKNFIEKFLEDLYVDDTTSGTKSIEEGKEFYVKTKKMMAEAGFDLRKWKTNNKELQKYFDNKETPIECNNKIVDDLSYLDTEVCSEESSYARVLGVEWDVEGDTFVFRFDKFTDLAKSLSATKRNILKVSASFYDPLGLISPVTARVKCIFQLLCKDSYEWDKEVNNEINNILFSFLTDFEHLKEIRVNRFCFVNLNEKVILIELNGFADNSNTVYCAVVHLKVVTSAVKVFFLASKTKVIPLKVLSILRLLWCVILAKLMKEIKESIRSRVLIDDTYCWTDSDVVLCWIKGKEKCWKLWVENRVVSVREIVRRERWNHVAGAVNTADIATRVCNESDFQRWFRGPEMYSRESEVENFDTEERLKQVERSVGGEAKVVGRRKGKVGKSKDDLVIRVVNAVIVEHAEFEKVESNRINENNIHKIIEITRYSSFKKLMMVTCYMLRFIKNISNKVSKIRKEVNADEYNIALKLWIKNEQSLLNFERNFDKLHNSLKLFDDHDKILR